MKQLLPKHSILSPSDIKVLEMILDAADQGKQLSCREIAAKIFGGVKNSNWAFLTCNKLARLGFISKERNKARTMRPLCRFIVTNDL
jgi:hypothetical protein